MGLRGMVTVEHRDKNGILKHYKSKHNTITELGKASALFFGVSALAMNDFSAPKITTGYPKPCLEMLVDSGTYTIYKYGVVECQLLADTAASISAKDKPTMFIPSSSNLIGFAGKKISGDTLDNKEGIRVDADVTGTNFNGVRLRYTWEGIEGNINTVGMKIAPTAIFHTIDNFFNDSYHYIPQKQNGVPLHSIAAGGASYNRLLDLDNLSLSSFTPSGSFDGEVAQCTLEYNGYTIECLTDELRVTNNANDATYTETWTGLKGIFVKNNVLYAYTFSSNTNTLYSLTVSDSATSSTVVSDISTVINSAHLSSGIIVNKLCGLADGVVYYEYNDGMGNWQFRVVPDISKADYYRIEMPFSFNSYDGPGTKVYCGNLIFEKYNRVVPADQIGWLFSYFDLEQTWEVEATDTVSVKYSYELTEVS